MGKCCGTCKYHEYDYKSLDWVCCNPDSEYEAEWTDYGDRCAEYEEYEEF